MKLFSTIIKMILPAIVITILALAVGTADAAPITRAATSGGPFTGTFTGYLEGDRGSRAPVELELVQTGREVEGTVTIGRGLLVNGGNCGVAAVPAGSQTAAGLTAATNSRHIDAGVTVQVSGLTVKIDLDGDLSRDGETLTAEAEVDLPWLCGRDPVIAGVFVKES